MVIPHYLIGPSVLEFGCRAKTSMNHALVTIIDLDMKRTNVNS
jgi:hypothetical protein